MQKTPFFVVFSQSQPWKSIRQWWIWLCCYCDLLHMWVLAPVKSMEELFVEIFLLDLKTMFLNLEAFPLSLFFNWCFLSPLTNIDNSRVRKLNEPGLKFMITMWVQKIWSVIYTVCGLNGPVHGFGSIHPPLTASMPTLSCWCILLVQQ